ncbi:MAG: hypothetical protein IKP23_05980 [Elusimicrobiaceae bacterium]|nr:hypothetical protein [Elusimicrobiaceae bacterium]
MKKHLLLVLSVLCCAVFASAQNTFEQAEKSYNGGLYKQAIKEYEPFLKSKKVQERYAAQLKTILAYNYLYKYDEALKTLYSFPLPKDNIVKAEYYLLQAQLLNRTLYAYQSPDLIESKEDPTKWTAGQKEKEIKNIYKKLWDMRETLILLQTKAASPYLTLNHYSNINNALTPTVYDYLLEEWHDQNILPYEQLLEESYKLEGPNRNDIRELYKIKRIMLFKNKDNQIEMAKCLDYISSYGNTCSLEKVKPYLFKAQYPLAKANALLESAKILEENQEEFLAFERLNVCLNTPKNYFTQSCKYAQENITRPFFYLTSPLPQDIAPNKDYAVSYKVANIETINGYIYKLDPQSLYKNDYYLNDKLMENLKQATPAKTFSFKPAYTKKYQKLDSKTNLPALESGFYYIILADASKTKNYFNENLFSTIINATDLALIQTSYNTTNNLYQLENKGSYAQFYALNAKTGEPLEKTKITTNLSTLDLNTNKVGQVKVKINQGLYNKKALGEYKNNYALLNNLQLVYRNGGKNPVYTINTDSAIYKPGQEVKMQIMASFQENSVWQPLANKTIEVRLMSPNWQDIEKQKVTLDEFGSANATFTLPKDAMLGNWTISTNYTNASFSVEEYKQPEFEITFDKYQGTPTFDTPLTINGHATYFRGDKVAKAKVSYMITKTYFRPWFCWWLPQRTDREKALEGTTQTDKDGNFSITWTPKQENKEIILPARYEVKVFITDQAGNTIQGAQNYTISKQKYFFAMKREQGFFTTDGKNTISVKMVNADEEALSGTAKATILKLKLKEDKQDFSLENSELFSEEKTIKTFEVSFNKKEPFTLTLPKLEEGVYQLKFSKDKDEGKLNFLVVNTKNTNLNLPSVAISQYDKYALGETALILLGNASSNTKYVEIFKQNFLIEQKNIQDKGIVLLEIPVKSSYSGGIYLRWFGAKNYQVHSQTLNIPVIFPNTAIKAEIKGSENLEPGTNAYMSLTAKDENNTPLEAKGIISVYDKALDYYRKHSLNLPHVYSSNVFGSALWTANFSSYNYFPVRMLYDGAMARGGSSGIRATKSLAMAKTAAPAAQMEMNTLTSADAIEMEESADFKAEYGTSAQKETSKNSLRQDFATTAYWNPSLDIKQGKANFSFKLPDLLTRWQILAALWTKDLKTGKAEFAITSTKDLFLTLQTPRFLREGDKIELRTMLVNNTEKSLNTNVSLYITLDGQKADELFKLGNGLQEITLAPKEQKVLTWPLETPKGTGNITINAIARSNDLLDGEEKTLPLLPSRQRVIENDTISLKEGINKLSLESLLKDKSLELETVQLNIDPSLIMPVLNAMPLLVEYRNPTLMSKLNNYYPLAVLNKLYQTYPEFKEAAAKLPKRKTITPAWQVDENLLLNQLEVSPWLNLSKGYKAQNNMNTLDIFDDSLVNKKQKELNKELTKYQNSDGSFSWIKGGQGSVYITLQYLEKVAMAKAWDIDIDENITKKALAYVTKEIKLNLTKPTEYNLTQALYLSVILTSFPSDWYNYDVKTLMEQSNNFINKMTPLGKAYSTLVWVRLGNKSRAQKIFASLMDSAEKADVNGIYWAPEAKSWQWFNDSITLHSAAIKALLELNPQDSRIKDLTKWILFQKGATLWGNSEQAATAVLTIFEVMKKTGALAQTKNFDITWNNQNISLEAKPFDIDESKFTLSAYGKEATPKSLSALIVKSKDSGLEDFASLTALYSSSKIEQESKPGMMNIKKEYYLVKDKKAILLEEGDEVEVGSEIQVRLTITCNNKFDFVSVSDLKPAAFENQNLLSSWQYKTRLSYYQEMQNSQTNFYFDYLPNGTYELKYTIRPTTSGLYNAGAAVIQSQFAPKFGAHSAGFYIKVK